MKVRNHRVVGVGQGLLESSMKGRCMPYRLTVLCLRHKLRRLNPVRIGLMAMLLTTQGEGFLSSPASRWSFTRIPSQARCTAIVKRVTVSGGDIPGKDENRVAAAAEPTATAGAAAATTPTLDATLRRDTSATKTAAIDQNVKDGAKTSKVMVQQNPVPTSEARPAKASAAAAIFSGKRGVSGADGKVVEKTPAVSAATKKSSRATPESSAAEKVLTLLELGLVDKEDMTAYYEALANLERTTKEVTEATTLSTKISTSTAIPPGSLLGQADPASLVPFPVICAALGAAGMHSLQLAGTADTIASVCGGAAGAAVGAIVAIGNDPVGEFARAAGAAIARLVGSAGGWAGKEVSASAAGIAEAAATAAEDALIKAPANAVGAVGNSIAETVSSSVTYVVGLPGQFVRNVFEGAKDVVLSTSEAAVKLPGGLAKKAANAAGEAIQSTSEVAVSAVKESPREATKKLQEVVNVVSLPKKVLEAATNLFGEASPAKGGQTAAGAPNIGKKVGPTVPNMAADNEDKVGEEDESERIAVEELEAKMSSVQEALERFDAVKSRIEDTRNSEMLRETMSMTRNSDPSVVKREGEVLRADREDGCDSPVVDGATLPPRAPSRPATSESKSARKPESQKYMDQDRRKQLADELLGQASLRVREAKANLKTAAAVARRKAAESADDAAGATVAAPARAGVAQATPVE